MMQEASYRLSRVSSTGAWDLLGDSSSAHINTCCAGVVLRASTQCNEKRLLAFRNRETGKEGDLDVVSRAGSNRNRSRQNRRNDGKEGEKHLDIGWYGKNHVREDKESESIEFDELLISPCSRYGRAIGSNIVLPQRGDQGG
jgi:hypothetical protein